MNRFRAMINDGLTIAVFMGVCAYDDLLDRLKAIPHIRAVVIIAGVIAWTVAHVWILSHLTHNVMLAGWVIGEVVWVTFSALAFYKIIERWMD